MVNREARHLAALALRRFLDGQSTNREFDREFSAAVPVLERCPDRALRAIYGFCWNFYDDFEEHRLEGEWALEPPVRAIAERCLLFLASDCPYEWKKTKLIGLDWRRIFARFLPWMRWESDPLKRFEAYLGEPAGEARCWPFYRAGDELQARSPESELCD